MKIIPLTQGLITVVDDADYEELSKFKWCAAKSGGGKWYAKRGVRRNGKVENVYMHREILNCRNGYEVDHDNGWSLDNRRGNLKEVTKAENLKNRKWEKKN